MTNVLVERDENRRPTLILICRWFAVGLTPPWLYREDGGVIVEVLPSLLVTRKRVP